MKRVLMVKSAVSVAGAVLAFTAGGVLLGGSGLCGLSSDHGDFEFTAAGGVVSLAAGQSADGVVNDSISSLDPGVRGCRCEEDGG